MMAGAVPSKRIDLSDSDIEGMVTLFKALSDPTRLRILSELTFEEALCVSKIAELLEISVSRASHHLTLLEHLGFVRGTQEGKQVLHSIDDDCIVDIMRRTRQHVAGE